MTEFLANLVGITIFVLVIAFSIAFHEWGHFTTARRYGVKVSEFMVGFGPLLWGRTRGETTYGLKAIPVGGYVRILGMFPPRKGAAVNMVPASTTGRFATMIEQARYDSLVEVGPQDTDRVFYKLPPHRRIVVMMAGPAMNLVLAAVLFTILLVGIGVPTATTTISSVVPCVPTVENPTGDSDAAGGCPTGSTPSPATSADIRAGDVVVAVDGNEVADWPDLLAQLAAIGTQTPAAVTLDRAGVAVTTEMELAEAVFPVVDRQGEPTGEVESRPFIGIRPESAYVPMSITEVPGYMWDITVRSVEALISMPARLWELATTLVTDGERDPNGPVSVVGVSRLGGEIAALDEPVKAKAAAFLGLAASLNLFLFLFNLLPLLPLDGGHAAAATYEAVRRRLAALQGRPDPGPVDTARLLPVTYAVAAVLLISGAIVIWADIVKPISLNG
jgi:membrane-associated protease RseP (regulator of RpoE activity)